MTFFKNKHLIAAMIVTPLLAFLGYYVVDLMVKETPKSAVAGENYKLIAKSNCRYTSGSCDLVNGEFKSTLRIEKNGQNQILTLTSSHSLQEVVIGLVAGENEGKPHKMSSADDASQSWSMPFNSSIDENTELRVAIVANDSYYFAQTTLGFIDYKTSFEKTF